MGWMEEKEKKIKKLMLDGYVVVVEWLKELCCVVVGMGGGWICLVIDLIGFGCCCF